MSKNKFYLSTYLGSEHAMGNMLIILSDTTLTRSDSRTFRHQLKEGDIALCECEPRSGGVYTIGMAKVLSFKEDGITPDKIENVLDGYISLTGDEKIIDHRKGHKPGCDCGA